MNSSGECSAARSGKFAVHPRHRNQPCTSSIGASDGSADCHAYHADWGSDDHHGHGTAMAGVCGYGDLASAIGNGQPVSVPYRMESVKIFPPVGQNPHELLGAITAGGVAKVEIAQPHRKRVFCLATSTDEDSPHRGRPTSWSAELDQLCFGSEVAPGFGRLFCVAAGKSENLNN